MVVVVVSRLKFRLNDISFDVRSLIYNFFCLLTQVLNNNIKCLETKEIGNQIRLTSFQPKFHFDLATTTTTTVFIVLLIQQME